MLKGLRASEGQGARLGAARLGAARLGASEGQGARLGAARLGASEGQGERVEGFQSAEASSNSNLVERC